MASTVRPILQRSAKRISRLHSVDELDANLLGKNIKKGTPVVFVDEPQGGRKS